MYDKRISLRANNLNTPTIKVNDRAGNLVEVAVVVWRVADTACAAFDVTDYGHLYRHPERISRAW